MYKLMQGKQAILKKLKGKKGMKKRWGKFESI